MRPCLLRDHGPAQSDDRPSLENTDDVAARTACPDVSSGCAMVSRRLARQVSYPAPSRWSCLLARSGGRDDLRAPASSSGGWQTYSCRSPIRCIPFAHRCVAHCRGRPDKTSGLASRLAVPGVDSETHGALVADVIRKSLELDLTIGQRGIFLKHIGRGADFLRPCALDNDIHDTTDWKLGAAID